MDFKRNLYHFDLECRAQSQRKQKWSSDIPKSTLKSFLWPQKAKKWKRWLRVNLFYFQCFCMSLTSNYFQPKKISSFTVSITFKSTRHMYKINIFYNCVDAYCKTVHGSLHTYLTLTKYFQSQIWTGAWWLNSLRRETILERFPQIIYKSAGKFDL